MSTPAERSDIAVLKNEMQTVKAALSRIEGKIDTQNATLVPRTEFDKFQKSVRLNYILITLATAVITAMAYALIVGRVK